MTNPTSAVAGLFVDHSDLAQFSETVNLNAYRTAGTSQSQSQNFWATPDRLMSSPVQEVLEINLTSTRLINWMTLDLARYPHTMMITYYNAALDAWLPLIDADTDAPVSHTIVQSVPQQIPSASTIYGHRHPQHSFIGHWESLAIPIRPTRVLQFRVILQRLSAGAVAPIDTFGRSVAYSLAVRDFALGYRVTGRADVPRTLPNPTSSAYHTPFASTDDLLGSSVDFALRANVADNILGNTDSDADQIWRCEPQPIADAVVCYYADLRTADGAAQVIDRIFLDPINNGAHVSLYHSNDIPVGGFPAQAEPVSSINYGPLSVVSANALDFGAYGDQAYLQINNDVIGYDPSLPWWVGITFETAFAPDVDGNEHPLIDCGAWKLTLNTNGVSLIVSTGDRLDLTFAYQGGQSTSVVVAYTGTSYHLHVINSGDENEGDLPVTTPIVAAARPVIVLGADGVNDDGTVTPDAYFNGEISQLVIKEETWVDDGYLTNSLAYTTVAEFVDDETPESVNALLRLNITDRLISADYPWGLFGGRANKYDQMIWDPVPRDYTMQRGWMYLQPTKARFWKFEITNLQAEYQDIYIGTPQVVRTFPPQAIAAYINQLSSAPPVPRLGQSTQASLVGFTPYSDFPQLVSTGGNTTGYTDTEVYVADDYETAQRLYANRGANWAYQDWHNGLSAPRFLVASRHQYTEQVLTRDSKIVYSVGLRQLVFARSALAVAQDTGQYEDMLFDDVNLASSNWVYDEDNQALTSGSSTQAVAVSTTFASQRNVRAIQFAASQSQPVQLLPDDDFSDPDLLNWSAVGDAQALVGVIDSPLLGSVVEIARNAVVGYWGDIAPLYPTYGDLVTNGVTYGDLSSSAVHDETEGGVASTSVVQPLGGRLYAAARVVSDYNLSSPLWVQIVDAITGAVLSESQIDVRAQQVTEWSTSYSIGDGGSQYHVTWGELSGGTAANWPSLNDTFLRPNNTTLGQMDSGQFWTTPTTSLHIASHLATVSAVGQRSMIDTNTPWGTLTVGLGNTVTTGTASASVPLIILGGYEVMNDGRVLDLNTGRVVATVTGITTGDTLAFAFMPTAILPSGQMPGGVDATITPWAFTISRNGTYQSTVCTVRTITTARGLAGQTAQAFSGFSWAPGASGVPNGEMITSMPMPTDGTLSLDGTFWTDSAGRNWSLTTPVTFGTVATYLGAANTFSATPAGGGPVSGVSVDVGPVNGTLSFAISQLAATVSTTTYYVALLDYTAPVQLYLRADGSLVQVVTGTPTVLKLHAVPSASMTTGDIAIKFVSTSTLSTAFKTTYGISNTSPQTLVFLVNDVVVGTYSGSNLWTSTTRGLIGYNDGASHNTVHVGYAWSTDANGVPPTGTSTWDDVDHHLTYTWGDVGMFIQSNLNPVIVRVVQKNASNDIWYMDTLSLFSDLIVWEFSNDAGKNYTPASDIRNNPYGVLLFPPLSAEDPAAEANQLQFRVTSWGPNSWVSHLAIRPWYQGFMQCVPSRAQGSIQGPNVNPHDHYPPIKQDPRFQVWSQPIPREWFFAFRKPVPVQPRQIPIVGEGLVL